MHTITIEDIAEALGISKTTVSRALSGKGRISEATKEKVRKYAAEHDYKPNVMARGLAQRRTYNIAVVTPDDNETTALAFFHRCLVGIISGTEEHGYDVLITAERGNRVNELERIVRNGKADGVILARTFIDDKRIGYLTENNIPCVVIGSSQVEGVVSIDNDNVGGSREMTERLIKRGVKKPALFGGSSEHFVTAQRLEGFDSALRENGLEIDEDLLFMDMHDKKVLEDAIATALAAGADCLLCMDDDIAERTLKICKAKDVLIPGQVSVASFYDSPVLEQTAPAISAVRYDGQSLGRKAAETLIKMIDGVGVSDIPMEGFEIRLRESTR
ncbi:MAG: LacI family transcriptional regulator [Lachnospiraceae bacterium]|nr:MAG: LacI family transcriptional regulator [Lachnospiraceae bacterium]